VEVEVETSDSVATSTSNAGEILRLPINHFEGNYTCDIRTLADIEDNDQIVLRYLDNPNGSMNSIAGVCSEKRNVVGMMPHPERACDSLTGLTDGLKIIQSFIANI
jgi:phosphoribosylformylglycinamidine synthase